MNAKEIIKGRISTLKHELWDAEFRRKERGILPGEIKDEEFKLAIVTEELGKLPVATDETVLAAKKKKKELESQLPKKEKGKDFPPEFAETLTALQEATEDLKTAQKNAKAYRDKKEDKERLEKSIGEKKATLALYELKVAEDENIISSYPAKIEETGACLKALDEEVTWPMMLARVSTVCEKEWKKKGKSQFCTDCPFYNKKNGKCNVQKEFASIPYHWHIPEMEFALQTAWGKGV